VSLVNLSLPPYRCPIHMRNWPGRSARPSEELTLLAARTKESPRLGFAYANPAERSLSYSIPRANIADVSNILINIVIKHGCQFTGSPPRRRGLLLSPPPSPRVRAARSIGPRSSRRLVARVCGRIIPSGDCGPRDCGTRSAHCRPAVASPGHETLGGDVLPRPYSDYANAIE